MVLEKPQEAFRPLIIILGAWVSYLVLIGLLQALGTGIGFKVWALGADRNWLHLLRHTDYQETLKDFWNLDHRNPLAAWWWLLIAPMVRRSEWGLHAAALVVSPIAAWTTYLVTNQLSYGRAKLFSVLVALMVLLWSPSADFDHVNRVMLIALCFTLCSVFLHAHFVDSGRTNASLFGFSLLCYLIALGTYTIQAGAVIAIPFIAYYRGGGTSYERLKRAIADTALFASILLVYVMFWATTSGVGSAFDLLSGTQYVHNFFNSLQAFFLPPSIKTFFVAVQGEFPGVKRYRWALVAALSALVLFFCLYRRFKRSGHSSSMPPLGWVILLLVVIGLPTVFVEAGNPTWGPGTRSPMVQQVWEPLLLVMLIFLVASRVKSEAVRAVTIFGCVGVLFTAVLYINLGYTHLQSSTTFYQRHLAQALKLIDSGKHGPAYYLVKIVNPVNKNVGSEPLLPGYAPTVLNRNNTSIRIFSNQPVPVPSFAPFWKVRFGQTGVTNGADYGNPVVIPYENLTVVFFDGNHLTLPSTLTKDDFDGLEVDWALQGALRQ